jgi:hypothetical protein
MVEVNGRSLMRCRTSRVMLATLSHAGARIAVSVARICEQHAGLHWQHADVTGDLDGGVTEMAIETKAIAVMLAAAGNRLFDGAVGLKAVVHA